jgi:hypothetical protein
MDLPTLTIEDKKTHLEEFLLTSKHYDVLCLAELESLQREDHCEERIIGEKWDQIRSLYLRTDGTRKVADISFLV